MPYVFIYHAGSQSFAKREDIEQIMLRSYNSFLQKWGFNTLEATRINHIAIGKIQAGRRQNFRVLEIGCGCGATLMHLKYLFPEAKVYGIENNPVAAQMAVQYAMIYCSMDNITEKSDYVIVTSGKVQEQKTKNLLNQGGIFISENENKR